MQAQSLYNDWWYLEVTADQNGARLFRRMRQINSQLSIEPIWQATGSTGDLQYELDTQTLTEFGSANVTVLASTANVGDSGLPTFVIANLNLDFDLSIDTIEHDLVEGWLGASPGPTVGDSTYFSIPRPRDVNVAHRFLTFTVTKPEGSTLTNVKVYVKGVDGFGVFTLSPNMPIVDESPGGIAVRENPNGSFAVRVTQEPSVFGTERCGECHRDSRGMVSLRKAQWTSAATTGAHSRRTNFLKRAGTCSHRRASTMSVASTQPIPVTRSIMKGGSSIFFTSMPSRVLEHGRPETTSRWWTTYTVRRRAIRR